MAHAGEFLEDDTVFAYYEIPEFVLITAESVFPINLSQCKVVVRLNWFYLPELTRKIPTSNSHILMKFFRIETFDDTDHDSEVESA